ncbi:hypothetical protein ACUODJ_51265, partial [Escherichia sp. HC-CC]
KNDVLFIIFNEHDHKRFSKGLARVFIDNYAAIPSESIRRLLALREAGIIHILALGEDYKMEINESRTVLKTEDNSYSFDFLEIFFCPVKWVALFALGKP